MSLTASSAICSSEREFEQDVDSLSIEELSLFLEKVKVANSWLTSENGLLEDVLKDAEKFSGPILLSEKARKATSSVRSASISSSATSVNITESDSKTPSTMYRRSRSKSIYAEMQPTLSVQYKCYIATKELRILKRVLEKLHNSKDIAFNEIKAKLQEVDYQDAEMKEARTEFNQTIRIEGKHPITRKIVGQKVHIYFVDSIKKKLIVTEKLRMQTLYEKARKRKVVQETQEKKELTKNLHEIDFTKVKIEHQKVNEMLREYNYKFLQLKARSNRSVQVLTDFRKELESEIGRIISIKKQIEWQERLQKVMESEMSVIYKQNVHLDNAKEVILKDPRQKLLPDVLQYARLKAEIVEKAREVNTWKSKVEYAERVNFLNLIAAK